MKPKRWWLTLVIALLGVTVAGVAGIAWVVWQDGKIVDPTTQAMAGSNAHRPKPAPNPQRNAYFGDLHVHTSISLDANIFDTQNGPHRAYEFAKGAEIELPGTRARQKLMAPLDFAAITDHAEGMGVNSAKIVRITGISVGAMPSAASSGP